MIASKKTQSSEEIFLNQDVFKEYQSYIKSTIGSELGKDKASFVESRLRKRILDLNCTFSSYLDLIKINLAEREFFVSRLTTHKTEWFREPQHFDHMCLWMKDYDFQEVKIWSAASSSGEECYSLAIKIKENFPSEMPLKILGTDIDSECLKKAQMAIYDKKIVVSQVSPALVKKYFNKSGNPSLQDYFKVDKSLQENIKFRGFNLVTDSLPLQNYFDFIFLRNVLIYFTPEKCGQIIDQISKNLKKGGLIYLGLSETLPKTHLSQWERVDTSVYRKL
ncbi:MAG: CheR family methyltransferase [Bacteriovoracaceae bacterium]